MKGLIFSIKRYSVHDGPGIRVTFFMKGCPLSCWWCHNPEGMSPMQEPVLLTRKVGDKEFQETEIAGRYYSVEEIVEFAAKDSVFFQQSGGGVTFSGGEPLFQVEFLLEALKACKANGYHTAVDTSGYSSQENINSIIPYTDLFLFDIKHLHDLKHQEYTGVSNIGILENLKLILKSRCDVMLRIPVIPGKNDDAGNLEELKKLFEGLRCDNLKRINLLPYHRIGSSKYKKLNIPFRMNDTEQPTAVRMRQLKEFFGETGIKVKIGG